MEQQRMALYATWIFNTSMKPMVQYFEKYYPELQPKVRNILKKGKIELLNGKMEKLRYFK